MASLISDPNGLRRIQWADVDGKRHQIRLGQLEKRTAERIKHRIESLVSAAATAMEPEEETRRWVEKLPDDLHASLARTGLVTPRQNETLKETWDKFVAGKTACSKNTCRNIQQGRRWFFKYFKEDQLLRSVAKNDADALRAVLTQSLGSPNTVNTVLKKVKQVFTDAVARGAVRASPFDHIKAPIRSNPERMAFVLPEWTPVILDACPDAEWKVIFGLARFAGVRVPSELQHLVWTDVLWDRDRVRIRDAKRSRDGKPVVRFVPLFPELRPLLMEAYEQSKKGATPVCPRSLSGSSNLRNCMCRIIKRAGLTPWTRIFQNMRSTRETELAEKFPLHVVNKWIGNTESVAMQHYLQVTKDHFERAAADESNGEWPDLDLDGLFEEAAQKAAQSQQNSSELATTGSDNGKTQVPVLSGTCAFSRSESARVGYPNVPPTGFAPVSPP